MLGRSDVDVSTDYLFIVAAFSVRSLSIPTNLDERITMKFRPLFSKRGLAGGTAAFGLLMTGALGAAFLSTASAESPDVSPPVLEIGQIAPGTATVFYDWFCDGTYNSTSIMFNADGTFTDGEGNDGTWVRVGGTGAGNQAGMISFQFDEIPTTYSSVDISSAATGIQSTFDGLTGCHYILGPQAPDFRRLKNDSHNAAGRLVK